MILALGITLFLVGFAIMVGRSISLADQAPQHPRHDHTDGLGR